MAGVIVNTPQGPYEFPSQEQADRYLAAVGQGQPPRSPETSGMDYARGAIRGTVRGLAAPADITSMALEKAPPFTPMGAANLITKQLLGRQGYQQPSEQALDLAGIEKPTGTGAKYLEEGVAGGIGGLTTGGPMGKLPALVSGAAGGLGGQAAADVAGDNPLSRIVGALLGSALGYGGLTMATGSRARHRLNELTKDIPDSTFDRMSENMRNAANQGVTLNAAQAVPGRTPLSAAVEQTAVSPKTGPKTMLRMEEQTRQARQAGDRLLGMMGPEKEGSEAALQAGKAATQAIDKAKDFRTNLVTPYYATKPQAPSIFKFDVKDLENKIAKASNESTDYGSQLKALSEQVGKAKTADELNSIYHEWNQGLKAGNLNNKPVVDHAAGKIRELGLKPIDALLDVHQVHRTGGANLYKQVTDKLVDPMKRSPVGRVAGQKGIQEDIPTATNRILSVLDAKDIKAQSILNLQKALDQQQPGTFASLARAAFAQKLENSFKPQAGQTPFDAPAKAAAAIWGGEGQTAMRENFRATMAGVARSQGLKGQAESDFVRGAEKIMQAIEAAGREKAVSGIAHQQPLAGEVAKGAGAIALYAPQATGVVSRAVERVSGGKMAKDLYELLWSGPEGVEKIRQIARMSIPQIRAAAATGALTGAVQQAQQAEK